MSRLLDRRTVLRGLGCAVGLPMLDAMVPSRARAAEPAPQRLVVVYLPNGMWMPHWRPGTVGEGSAWALSPALEPLGPHKDDLLVLSGLRNVARGPDDAHATSISGFLTGENLLAPLVGTTGGASLDQLLASARGGATPFASLELSSEGTLACVGRADCRWSESVSWLSATRAPPRERDPLALFERLFGAAGGPGGAARAAERRKRDLLVVDAVIEDSARLDALLGAADRARLDELTTALFELERALRTGGIDAACRQEVDTLVPAERLEDRLDDDQHARLMLDMIALALRCDLTRVVTWQVGNELSRRQFPWLGVDFQHHSTSHHLGRPQRIADLLTIGRWETGLVGHLLDRLAGLREPDGGRLLDTTLVVTGAGMGDPDPHAIVDLPVVLAGGASLGVRTGRHVDVGDRALGDLLLGLAHTYGLTALRSFGAEGEQALSLS